MPEVLHCAIILNCTKTLRVCNQYWPMCCYIVPTLAVKSSILVFHYICWWLWSRMYRSRMYSVHCSMIVFKFNFIKVQLSCLWYFLKYCQCHGSSLRIKIIKLMLNFKNNITWCYPQVIFIITWKDFDKNQLLRIGNIILLTIIQCMCQTVKIIKQVCQSKSQQKMHPSLCKAISSCKILFFCCDNKNCYQIMTT